MQTGQTTEVQISEKQTSVWREVTPLSRYLALALFVLLPFLGGYIGYVYAPDKVAESTYVVDVSSLNNINKDSVRIDTDKYTWVSYSRLLRWEQIKSQRGSNGYGFQIEIPVTNKLSENYPSISGQDQLEFVYEDDGNSIGMVSVSFREDDDTDYTTENYTKATNKNGLTYYQYDSGHSGDTNILLAFSGIDNGDMTLSLLISDISSHLSDDDIQRIIDSVIKTNKFDSGD